MSSGGMDWAYRIIARGSLDPLGVAVVLHLGWRDAASQRTDRGIARALSQHRSAICKATAKLEALGIITRRSGQWVACETVAIIEESAGAPRPAASVSDGVDHSVGRTTQWAVGGPLSGPPKDHSVGHMRKEKRKKEARAEIGRGAGRSASSRIETARPASSVATVAVDRGGVAAPAAAPALSSDEKARRAAFVAGLGLPVRDPASGVWQAAAAVLAESGGGL